MADAKKPVTVAISVELYERLSNASASLRVSKSFLVEECLQDFLPRYESAEGVLSEDSVEVGDRATVLSRHRSRAPQTAID